MSLCTNTKASVGSVKTFVCVSLLESLYIRCCVRIGDASTVCFECWERVNKAFFPRFMD
jgi:hypothetical protein